MKRLCATRALAVCHAVACLMKQPGCYVLRYTEPDNLTRSRTVPWVLDREVIIQQQVYVVYVTSVVVFIFLPVISRKLLQIGR